MRMPVNLAMTALLVAAMGYKLWGSGAHKPLGVALLLLFALHHWLNGGWWRALAKGRWTPARRLVAAVDLGLLVAALMAGASGIVFMLHWRAGYALARPMHMLGAYWTFALAAVHIGLHAGAWLRRLPRWAKAALALAALYGAWAFATRGYAANMLLLTRYAFLDYGEPWALFIADHLAMLCAGAALGWAALRKCATINASANNVDKRR